MSKELNENDPKKINNTIESKVTKLIYNIVFLGRPGSGKLTAINQAGNGLIFTSEDTDIKSTKLMKSNKSSGINYSELQMNAVTKLRLYGTPGQKKYNSMHEQAMKNADIFIIMIDLSSITPFAEFIHYKNTIETAGNNQALRVVAFTHYDHKEHNMTQLSNEIRSKSNGEILTVKIDARKAEEVKFMLEKAVEMKRGSVPLQKYYAENSLFLRDINA